MLTIIDDWLQIH